ncbi:hypothetical protein Lser_V15G41297 [Lactuca serriola]
MDTHQPTRSFGTILAREDSERAASFKVYKETTGGSSMQQQSESSKPKLKHWNSLRGRAERNKENNVIPAKWTLHKIPQRPVARTAAPVLPCIEVFVDEECLGTECCYISAGLVQTVGDPGDCPGPMSQRGPKLSG